MPVICDGPEVYMSELFEIAERLNVKEQAEFVIGKPEFSIWSGSSRIQKHHYGKGGLIVHTTEVVELCLLNNNYFPKEKQAPEDQLFLAALFHDVGKIWDYTPIDENHEEWTVTPHKHLIHHISRSAIFWQNVVDSTGYPKEKGENVLHAILSHHGLKEWGSPVSPDLTLSWVLHLCDSLSAKIDKCFSKGIK